MTLCPELLNISFARYQRFPANLGSGPCILLGAWFLSGSEFCMAQTLDVDPKPPNILRFSPKDFVSNACRGKATTPLSTQQLKYFEVGSQAQLSTLARTSEAKWAATLTTTYMSFISQGTQIEFALYISRELD